MSDVLLPDDLWERLEPLLPKPRRKNRHVQFAGRKPSEPRQIVQGILFVLRTGIPWRRLPATSDFPSGYTCRRYLRRWNRRGIWQRLFEALLAELQKAHQIDWYRARVDSASLRAPSGGAKTGPNPTDRRKRGSKHHLLTDAQGIPLAMVLTKANRHDVTQLLPLLDKIPPVRGKPGPPQRRPKQLQGDRAYDSEPHRQELKKRGESLSWRNVGRRTAAAWGKHAGSSNAVSRGCTSSAS
jgi:transposase